jgi:hypothetical protein
VLEATPDTQGDTSAGPQDPMHFPQRAGLIWEELEALLAQHHIVALIVARECPGIPLAPVDCRPRRGGMRSGDLQHAGIQVDAGDQACRADLLRREARHNPGATGHIEHPFPRPEGNRRQKKFRERLKQAGNLIPLRLCWTTACELPRLLLTHRHASRGG